MHQKNPDKISENGNYIVSCEIISKHYINRRGEKSDKIEYFLRRSIQDYFIKFCESDIKQLQIQQYLKSKESDFVKMITVEVEFRNGLWDDCSDNKEVESRKGEYVVVKTIL